MIKGEHNAANALAAASVAVALGIDDDGIRRALILFAPLEHRIEPCGSVAGVACYNDSKATNVDATLKALAAFDPDRPIVLLGGDDKGTDLSELVDAARATAKRWCASVRRAIVSLPHSSAQTTLPSSAPCIFAMRSRSPSTRRVRATSSCCPRRAPLSMNSVASRSAARRSRRSSRKSDRSEVRRARWRGRETQNRNKAEKRPLDPLLKPPPLRSWFPVLRSSFRRCSWWLSAL